MPRSANQKKKLAVLRSILLERTGVGHPMTMKEIIRALDTYGISAERKSIYDDIETLRELGTDIRTVRGKTVGYYVAERDFELAELKMLVDAVRSSKFITESKSAQLIKKLSSLAGAHDRNALNRVVFVSNRAKSMNEDIYTTVDRIHEAIEQNLCIRFRYFSWTYDKKKELRKGGEFYNVSPWSLVWDDSNYYLIGFDNDKQELRHYRVDKMLRTSVTDSARIGREEFEKYDITSYSGAVFGMFGGKPERVALSCAKSRANVIFDRFGTDITVLDDGDSFRIHATIVPSPVFIGWVLGFGGDVKVLSPDHVVQTLKEIQDNYK